MVVTRAGLDANGRVVREIVADEVVWSGEQPISASAIMERFTNQITEPQTNSIPSLEPEYKPNDEVFFIIYNSLGWGTISEVTYSNGDGEYEYTIQTNDDSRYNVLSGELYKTLKELHMAVNKKLKEVFNYEFK